MRSSPSSSDEKIDDCEDEDDEDDDERAVGNGLRDVVVIDISADRGAILDADDGRDNVFDVVAIRHSTPLDLTSLDIVDCIRIGVCIGVGTDDDTCRC